MAAADEAFDPNRKKLLNQLHVFFRGVEDVDDEEEAEADAEVDVDTGAVES